MFPFYGAHHNFVIFKNFEEKNFEETKFSNIYKTKIWKTKFYKFWRIQEINNFEIHFPNC